MPTNGLAQTVDDIINFAAFKIGVPVAKAAIKKIPYLAWLNLPIISTLFDWALNWLANFFYQPTVDYTSQVIIKLQTNAQKDAYSHSEQILRTAHLSGDPNELKKASDNFDEMLGHLITFDGWTR